MKSKLNKIRKNIEKKYIEAVNYQRNGNLREYAQCLSDVEKLEDLYEKTKNEGAND